MLSKVEINEMIKRDPCTGKLAKLLPEGLERHPKVVALQAEIDGLRDKQKEIVDAQNGATNTPYVPGEKFSAEGDAEALEAGADVATLTVTERLSRTETLSRQLAAVDKLIAKKELEMKQLTVALSNEACEKVSQYVTESELELLEAFEQVDDALKKQTLVYRFLSLRTVSNLPSAWNVTGFEGQLLGGMQTLPGGLSAFCAQRREAWHLPRRKAPKIDW